MYQKTLVPIDGRPTRASDERPARPGLYFADPGTRS